MPDRAVVMLSVQDYLQARARAREPTPKGQIVDMYSQVLGEKSLWLVLGQSMLFILLIILL